MKRKKCINSLLLCGPGSDKKGFLSTMVPPINENFGETRTWSVCCFFNPIVGLDHSKYEKDTGEISCANSLSSLGPEFAQKWCLSTMEP